MPAVFCRSTLPATGPQRSADLTAFAAMMASSARPSVSLSCPSSSRPAHCHGGPGRGAIKRTSGGTGAAQRAVFPPACHRFLTAQRSGGSFAAIRWRARVGPGRRQRESLWMVRKISATGRLRQAGAGRCFAREEARQKSPGPDLSARRFRCDLRLARRFAPK